MHCLHGPTERWMMSSTIASSLARVSFLTRCFGPVASAVMNGRLISVSIVGGELDLGALGRIAQPLQRHLVAFAAQVQALVFLELFDQPVHDALVDVVAAQVRVAVGGLHFDHAFADLQNRDVERAAAEVVDGDRFVLLSCPGRRPAPPPWAR